jgi:hypothetical protein
MVDIKGIKLVELAPLPTSFAMHLATHLLTTLPKQSGRPHKDEQDIVARTERRFFEAMDDLIAHTRSQRQTVYDLVNAAFSTGDLTAKWLIQTLYTYTPRNTIVYPQRLREWRKAKTLLSIPGGQLDPQSVSCILLARLIDRRRNGWLPQPATIESFWVWRQDDPGHEPYPYELPISSVDPADPTVVKRQPLIGEQPYVLYTPWKGAAWDDADAWDVTDHGAIRWVGSPDDAILAQWGLLQEREHLFPSDAENLSRQALRMLADRLQHSTRLR